MRARHKRGENITKDHKEIGYEGADWIHLPVDRDMRRTSMNRVINLRIP
jgi:hypothetical protein